MCSESRYFILLRILINLPEMKLSNSAPAYRGKDLKKTFWLLYLTYRFFYAENIQFMSANPYANSVHTTSQVYEVSLSQEGGGHEDNSLRKHKGQELS